MTPTPRDKQHAIEDAILFEFGNVEDFYNDEEPNGHVFHQLAEMANDILHMSFPGADIAIDEDDILIEWCS